jgi:polysaccharide deacetylase 2 family uncharacterized protein YibQ
MINKSSGSASQKALNENLTNNSDKPYGKLAIVIDDFGQDRNGVKEMMSINRHITFAVMPFLTYSQTDAENAYQKGFEIIVHLPMEPVKGKISWLGPKPILSTSSDNDVYQITSEAFLGVPYAVGANIHMGSKISTDERIMSDVLDIIKEKGVYFLDSKTSAKSVAKKISNEKAVPFYERNVFLDGQTNKEHVKGQLRKAGEIALRDGKSIAIGHVGIEGGKITAQAIIEMLAEFDEKNIQLVFVSELEN